MKNAIALSLWRGMTACRFKKMLHVCENEEQLFALKAPEWRRLGFSEDLLRARIMPSSGHVASVVDWMEESGACVLPFNDESYPPLLREIGSAPLVLYACGQVDVLAKKQVAIVGSRKATPKALELAYELASDLVANGIVVTSGLALGVDSAAHRGALENEGQTVAVMANGLGSVYPFSNAHLAKCIQEKGVLLSEQPPWVGPSAKLFPQRNRIVSGLCQGVLVVQANVKSGSLITARLALEQNREVMAMPGEVGSAHAKGCHWLLKQGAALVETIEDIYHCMGWDSNHIMTNEKEKTVVSLSENEQALLECIDTTDTSVEKIVERFTGASETVLSALSQLELSGLVQRTVLGYCRR